MPTKRSERLTEEIDRLAAELLQRLDKIEPVDLEPNGLGTALVKSGLRRAVIAYCAERRSNA